MKKEIEEFKNKNTYTVEDIRTLVKILRCEQGCAWDREQTHESIRNAMIEETYEFIEGLDNHDTALMKEELGDVLFQVFFHAGISEEEHTFTINDVADGVCKKMVSRHPHVFGDVTVKNADEVVKNWDAIKKAEKNRNTVEKQLESVPKTLPSLIRAEKLLSRYKKEGGTVDKNPESLVKNVQALAQNLTPKADEQALGELLFAIANLTYAKKINAEQALYNTNERFVKEHEKE